MTVLQVCAYGAEYAGNFIASLSALECALKDKGIDTIYAFVERARNMPWCEKICRRTKVYFLPEEKARISPKTYWLFHKIYKENNIGIVHSHFELYDIPATVMAPQDVKIFWHLHDPINGGDGLRKILWKLQYGVVSKKARLLSVADYYRQTAISMGFPEEHTTTILNSIDISRINNCKGCAREDVLYDFLTFGWDFYRKGDDIILKACERLHNEGYNFRLLLNGNKQTWPTLDEFYDGNDPEWLVRGNPVPDVNTLFAKSKVFIQASRKETFSYAVCEAAYAGLPVISSDISGLEWAHRVNSVHFFENENIGELCSLMKMALKGNLSSEKEISKSQRVIEDEFSLKVWADNIINQYELTEC